MKTKILNLEELGWNSFFADQIAGQKDSNRPPARIIQEHRSGFIVMGPFGERPAELSGRLRYHTDGEGRPTVGDWVTGLRTEDGPYLIEHVLLRRSLFERRSPGGESQKMAANIDTAFIVSSLNQEFNPRRLERYFTAVWESGAKPVVILTKADLCHETSEIIVEVEKLAPGLDVHAISVVDGTGIEALQQHLKPGVTVVLLGSSGVGKSTLANRLLGYEHQETGGIREDDGKGRHTTSSRHLLQLPGGALLIDTPGLRELQIIANEESLDATFEDIADLTKTCRFRDCQHEQEPGCAVRQALADKSLDPGRLASWRKLLREIEAQAARTDKRLQSERRQKWKKVHLQMRQRKKFEGR